MIEYMSSAVAALVVVPAVAVAFAATWRRDVAAISGIAVSARAHSVSATRVFGTGTDAGATKYDPQSRGSCR